MFKIWTTSIDVLIDIFYETDSGLWVHRPFLKGLCCLIFGFWCRVLWIIFCALLAIVLSVPLYGYVYSFGIFKLFYHFVVYLLFIYKLYIPDHAYMFHNEYKTCLAKLLYMYLFSICKAYFHQTQFTRLS